MVLACGKPRHLIPPKVLGVDVFSILDRLGILSLSAKTWLGKRIKERDPFPNTGIDLSELARLGIELKPKLAGFDQTAEFTDGSQFMPDVIVWALGYRNNFDWVEIDQALVDGRLYNDKGQTSVPGLYTLSQPWQNDRRSALICGAKSDMERLMPTIIEHHASAAELATNWPIECECS